MLDSNLKNQLKHHFAGLKEAVELTVTLDNSSKSKELAQLAHALTELSEHIKIVDKPLENLRAPLLSIQSPIRKTRIDFAGVPMGHEFTSLVLAILHTGGHPVKLSDDERVSIEEISEPLNFEIYISLSCQTCPQVVQALNTLAALNSNIKTVMIDGALFQEEVESKNIMSVPSVYLNGELFSQGALDLTAILTKVNAKSAHRISEQLNERSVYDVLVVGGGPAGASAAIYSARKGLNTGVVAERFGGQVADTLAIENFISVRATEGPKLVAQLEEHVNEYDVDVIKGQRVSSYTRAGLHEVTLDNGATLKAKSLIIATGARWRNINVPGEQEYKGRGVAYCPHCDGPLFKGKPVAVIGGGNSGIEAAIDLANLASHVTVLEFAPELKADQVLIDKLESLNNVSIVTHAQTTKLLGNGQNLTGLEYLNRETNTKNTLELNGVFVQIGLIPNTEWLKDSPVQLSSFGEIEIAADGRTSESGVFAAGDVTNTPYKQIIIAMGSGATASLGAFDYLIRHSEETIDNQVA